MGYTLVLGGARSGKSDYAVHLAVESQRPVTFIATATADDAEMAERIEHHRAARPPSWTTVEAPLDLTAALTATTIDHFVVVDCLTLWLSNLLGAEVAAADCLRLSDQATALLAGRSGVVVSNEVGLGIVPDNQLARSYRDLLGSINRRFAQRADRAVLMVAGRALELRPAT